MFYTSTLNKMFDDFFTTDTGVSRVPVYDQDSIHIPLPGYGKEDIVVDIEGRTLIISAEIPENEETYFRRSFMKTYVIGSNINPETIEAKMENGVLSLNMDRAKVTKRISIL